MPPTEPSGPEARAVTQVSCTGCVHHLLDACLTGRQGTTGQHKDIIQAAEEGFEEQTEAQGETSSTAETQATSAEHADLHDLDHAGLPVHFGPQQVNLIVCHLGHKDSCRLSSLGYTRGVYSGLFAGNLPTGMLKPVDRDIPQLPSKQPRAQARSKPRSYFAGHHKPQPQPQPWQEEAEEVQAQEERLHSSCGTAAGPVLAVAAGLGRSGSQLLLLPRVHAGAFGSHLHPLALQGGQALAQIDIVASGCLPAAYKCMGKLNTVVLALPGRGRLAACGGICT